MGSLVVLMLLAFVTPAFAQEPAPQPEAQAPSHGSQAPSPKPQARSPKPQAPESQIDATKLGVSLDKIQKGLRIAESREQVSGDAYRLKFNIEVFAPMPKIEVLKGIDLVNGAVPGTAPSHNQMIEYWTPPIYRSPTMPVSAFAVWLAQRAYEKSKKTRCEEEVANYRALVMQGVNVSAPTCTQ